MLNWEQYTGDIGIVLIIIWHARISVVVIWAQRVGWGIEIVEPHVFKTECNLERKYNHCECEKHEGEEEDDDDVDICFCKKEKKDDRRRWIRRSRIDDGDDDDEFDGEDRYNCRGDRCDLGRRRRSNYNDRKGDRLKEIKEEI